MLSCPATYSCAGAARVGGLAQGDRSKGIRQCERAWVFGSRRIRSGGEGAFPWLTPFFAAANVERRERNGTERLRASQTQDTGAARHSDSEDAPLLFVQYLGSPFWRDRVRKPGMPLAEVGTWGGDSGRGAG